MPTIARSGSAVTTAPKRLANKWRVAVRDGDGWDTAYKTAISVLDAAARADWTWDDVTQLFGDSALYRDAYLTRTDDGTRRNGTSAAGRLLEDWLEAVNLIGRTPAIVNAVGAYAAILKIRDAARHHQWTGRTQLKDRIVLNALLDIADALGTVNPQVSARTLCEDTPYREHRSVSRALLSLAARGWLTVDRGGLKRSEPSIYRLKLPTSELGRYVLSQDIALYPVGTSATVRTPSAERVTPSDGPAARKLAIALTPHQQAVYAALTRAPQSRNQIVRASGVSRPSTSRALLNLALAGLARKKIAQDDEDLGWVLGDTDPGEVVFERSVDAVEDARRERHAGERARWQDHCEGRMSDKQKAMVRADALNRKADAEALRNLAKRPPKPRPKWRDDAAPFNEAVRASLAARSASPVRGTSDRGA